MMTPASCRSIFGVFHGRKAAESCFRALIGRGFLQSEIGLLLNTRVRETEFHAVEEREAPSEDEVLITGTVTPTVREQVARRVKELESQGVGAMASVTAVREADMEAHHDSMTPTLATLVEVATPLSVDGTEFLIFGLSPLSAQSDGKTALTNLVDAFTRIQLQPGDAEQLCHELKSDAILLGITISDQDETEIRRLMLDHSATETFVGH